MNPCPQCGAPLRWIPEGNYWNCDRCGNRVAPSAAPPTPQPHAHEQSQPHAQPGTYPPPMHGGPQGYPPQHGYPPQGYPPQGYGHYPHPGAPRGKGKLIAIILVVAALAAGGIVLAVVLSKKGSSGDGFSGADSGEALAKTFVETLASGDGEKLVALSPSLDTMVEYSDCPAEKLEENKKQYTESLGKSREVAPSFKDHGLAYKGIEPMGEKKDFKAGDEMGDCKAKKPFAMANYMVEFEYDGADKTKKTFKTNMFTVVLDGKFYLSPGPVARPDDLAGGAPTTPTSPDIPTAPPSADTAALESELGGIRTAACACTDKACADAQWEKLAAFGAQHKADVDGPGKEKLMAIGAEAIACMDKLRGQPTPPEPPTPPSEPPPPAPPAEPGKGLPECEAYAKAAERFIKCNKVPKQSRDAVQTAVDTMRKNWGDPSTMSEDMRKSAAETCTTLEKSMKDAAKAIGCK